MYNFLLYCLPLIMDIRVTSKPYFYSNLYKFLTCKNFSFYVAINITSLGDKNFQKYRPVQSQYMCKHLNR